MASDPNSKLDIDCLIHEIMQMATVVSILTEQVQDEINETRKLVVPADLPLIDRLRYLHDAAAFLASNAENKAAELREAFDNYSVEA